MPDPSFRRILREPLFHFFLLGLGIFALYAWANQDGGQRGEGERIVISAPEVDRMVQQFRATWRRPPTQPELEGLLESLVREEILVREAVALGLDRDDSVIRNRLAQKMTFLTTSVAQSMLPEDEVLVAHMQANPERFLLQGVVAFDQVAINATTDIDATLAALNGGSNPEEIGAPSLLPPSLPLSPVQVVDATFGQAFFASVQDLPEGVWSGPVRSGYGMHLVRVNERRPAVLPPFETVREQVLADWRRDQTETLTTAQLDALRESYEIELPAPEDLAQWTAQ